MGSTTTNRARGAYHAYLREPQKAPAQAQHAASQSAPAALRHAAIYDQLPQTAGLPPTALPTANAFFVEPPSAGARPERCLSRRKRSQSVYGMSLPLPAVPAPPKPFAEEAPAPPPISVFSPDSSNDSPATSHLDSTPSSILSPNACAALQNGISWLSVAGEQDGGNASTAASPVRTRLPYRRSTSLWNANDNEVESPQDMVPEVPSIPEVFVVSEFGLTPAVSGPAATEFAPGADEVTMLYDIPSNPWDYAASDTADSTSDSWFRKDSDTSTLAILHDASRKNSATSTLGPMPNLLRPFQLPHPCIEASSARIARTPSPKHLDEQPNSLDARMAEATEVEHVSRDLDLSGQLRTPTDYNLSGIEQTPASERHQRQLFWSEHYQTKSMVKAPAPPRSPSPSASENEPESADESVGVTTPPSEVDELIDSYTVRTSTGASAEELVRKVNSAIRDTMEARRLAEMVSELRELDWDGDNENEGEDEDDVRPSPRTGDRPRIRIDPASRNSSPSSVYSRRSSVHSATNEGLRPATTACLATLVPSPLSVVTVATPEPSPSFSMASARSSVSSHASSLYTFATPRAPRPILSLETSPTKLRPWAHGRKLTALNKRAETDEDESAKPAIPPRSEARARHATMLGTATPPMLTPLHRRPQNRRRSLDGTPTTARTAVSQTGANAPIPLIADPHALPEAYAAPATPAEAELEASSATGIVNFADVSERARRRAAWEQACAAASEEEDAEIRAEIALALHCAGTESGGDANAHGDIDTTANTSADTHATNSPSELSATSTRSVSSNATIPPPPPPKDDVWITAAAKAGTASQRASAAPALASVPMSIDMKFRDPRPSPPIPGAASTTMSMQLPLPTGPAPNLADHPALRGLPSPPLVSPPADGYVASPPLDSHLTAAALVSPPLETPGTPPPSKAVESTSCSVSSASPASSRSLSRTRTRSNSNASKISKISSEIRMPTFADAARYAVAGAGERARAEAEAGSGNVSSESDEERRSIEGPRSAPLPTEPVPEASQERKRRERATREARARLEGRAVSTASSELASPAIARAAAAVELPSRMAACHASVASSTPTEHDYVHMRAESTYNRIAAHAHAQAAAAPPPVPGAARGQPMGLPANFDAAAPRTQTRARSPAHASARNAHPRPSLAAGTATPRPRATPQYPLRATPAAHKTSRSRRLSLTRGTAAAPAAPATAPSANLNTSVSYGYRPAPGPEVSYGQRLPTMTTTTTTMRTGGGSVPLEQASAHIHARARANARAMAVAAGPIRSPANTPAHAAAMAPAATAAHDAAPPARSGPTTASALGAVRPPRPPHAPSSALATLAPIGIGGHGVSLRRRRTNKFGHQMSLVPGAGVVGKILS